MRERLAVVAGSRDYGSPLLSIEVIIQGFTFIARKKYFYMTSLHRTHSSYY